MGTMMNKPRRRQTKRDIDASVELVAKHFANMRIQHVTGMMVYPKGDPKHIEMVMQGTQEAWLALVLAFAHALGVDDKFDAIRKQADDILLERGKQLMESAGK